MSRPARRVTPAQYEAAAARLVSADAGDIAQAARRFVQAAPAHGIDLALMWATFESEVKPELGIRQVCLAVLGAGRTAVLFLSSPLSSRTARSSRETEQAERIATIQAAVQWLSSEKRGGVRVVQSLPEPREAWAIAALEGAGLVQVGDLAYLRCPLARRRGAAPTPQPWPTGVQVRSVGALDRGQPDRALLAEALDLTYEKTLDCPGLCGMRETHDVIDSHLSTGRFDPSYWWLLLVDGRPEGCALFNPSPEQSTVELVYLGLSARMRGRGLARMLLAHGMLRLGGPGQLSVTCAVDRRNAPAISLYRRAGFGEFSGRLAYVRAIP